MRPFQSRRRRIWLPVVGNLKRSLGVNCFQVRQTEWTGVNYPSARVSNITIRCRAFICTFPSSFTVKM